MVLHSWTKNQNSLSFSSSFSFLPSGKNKNILVSTKVSQYWLTVDLYLCIPLLEDNLNKSILYTKLLAAKDFDSLQSIPY